MEPARDSATAPHYRAGVTFIDADREALEAFCARNQQHDRDEP
jgi:hypothetical protein